MYEHYITASPTNVHSIDYEIDEQTFFEDMDTLTGVSLTVTFAVTTDSVAWLTVNGNGLVYPAFGGTGTSQTELDEYARTAIHLFETITGRELDEYRYAVDDDHPYEQDDNRLLIDT